MNGSHTICTGTRLHGDPHEERYEERFGLARSCARRDDDVALLSITYKMDSEGLNLVLPKRDFRNVAYVYPEYSADYSFKKRLVKL